MVNVIEAAGVWFPWAAPLVDLLPMTFRGVDVWAGVVFYRRFWAFPTRRLL